MSISKYPLQQNDKEGLTDAVNYLLSGPAGLGQNFSGFSSNADEVVRPDTDPPHTVPQSYTPSPKLVVSISINNIEACDFNGTPTPGVSTEFVIATFSSAQPSAPYAPGDLVEVSNVVDDYPAAPSTRPYNGFYRCITSTTTDIILTSEQQDIFPNQLFPTGNIGLDWRNYIIPTDCEAIVTVNSATDRVFVNGQCLFNLTMTSIPFSRFDLFVSLFRETGVLDPLTQEIKFDGEVAIVSDSIYPYAGTFTDVVINPVFPTFIDESIQYTNSTNLPINVYKYFIGFQFITDPNYSYAGQPTGGVSGFDGGGVGCLGTGITQTATYYGVIPTTVTGSGSGFVTDVTIDTTNYQGYVKGQTVTFGPSTITGGSGYKVGDELLILGTDLGGASPANDMTLIVTRIEYPSKLFTIPNRLGVGDRSLTAQVVKQ